MACVKSLPKLILFSDNDSNNNDYYLCDDYFNDDTDNEFTLSINTNHYDVVNIDEQYKQLDIQALYLLGDGKYNLILEKTHDDMDKDSMDNETIQYTNLPDSLEFLHINFNTIDIQFSRDWYNIYLDASKNYNSYTILNEPIEHILEIDYNVLSPSGNLKEIELPDIIVHYNKLINVPDYVNIQMYEYFYPLYDSWVVEIEDAAKYD